MKNIILVGFGGHAKSVADVVERQKLYKIVGYTDFKEQNSIYNYLGTDDNLEKIYNEGVEYAVLCIGFLGKGDLRERLYSKLKSIGYSLPIIIDPSAIISKNVTIEEGTFIGKGAIINSEAKIGKCCIINTGSIIEHESVVGDYSHISVGTVVCGQAHIGKRVFAGANSTIIQCTEVNDNEIIPAGKIKKNNVTVFGSVLYDGAITYFNDFVESINNQSSRDFDVLLINDNIMDTEILNDIKEKIFRRKVTLLDYTDKKKSPAELRIELIKEAKKLNYKLIVMGDCDDTFSSNRILNTINTYELNKEFTFFYNDLKFINGQNVFKRLPYILDRIDPILESNFVGLSMSALNLNKIDFSFIESLLDCRSFVFDWYLFSRLILSNMKGMYVDNCCTFYRIYDGNFAGINKPNIENLKKEKEVKLQHYRLLSAYDKRYRQLYKKIKLVNLEDIKINRQNQFWWSNIIVGR